MPSSPKKKLYCYVDETGQDTRGVIFIVSVVVAAEEREAAEQRLMRIEKESGKGVRKWTKTNRERRSAYIARIFEEQLVKGKLLFGVHHDTVDYVGATIRTTARAIEQVSAPAYRATVIIDGLHRSEQRLFAVQLRKYGIEIHKVRGATEQGEIFIRLADALCGFLREALTGNEVFQALMQEGLRDGFLVEVRGK